MRMTPSLEMIGIWRIDRTQQLDPISSVLTNQLHLVHYWCTERDMHRIDMRHTRDTYWRHLSKLVFISFFLFISPSLPSGRGRERICREGGEKTRKKTTIINNTKANNQERAIIVRDLGKIPDSDRHPRTTIVEFFKTLRRTNVF